MESEPPTDSVLDGSSDVPLFRFGKKRKAYRQRPSEEAENATRHIAEPILSTKDTDLGSATPNETGPDASRDSLDVLRLRKLRKHRHSGVAFGNGPYSTRPADAASENQSGHSMTSEGADTSIGRFARPMGTMAVDVDKHM
jgi:hypothetical protein